MTVLETRIDQRRPEAEMATIVAAADEHPFRIDVDLAIASAAEFVADVSRMLHQAELHPGPHWSLTICATDSTVNMRFAVCSQVAARLLSAAIKIARWPERRKLSGVPDGASGRVSARFLPAAKVSAAKCRARPQPTVGLSPTLPNNRMLNTDVAFHWR